MVVIVLLLLMAIVLTSMSVVTSREQDVRHSRNRMLARLVAQSGVQRQVSDIHEARDLAAAGSPFGTIQALDSNPAVGVGGFTATYTGEELVDFEGVPIGEYDVLVDVQTVAADTRHVRITCYAYVPSKADFEAGVSDAVRADAHTVTEVALRGSEVFDYAYFINHWGWFYGNSIFSNGNVRSNGQFDFGGYGATVNGSPRYMGAEGTNLVGYLDDNGDGVTDGSDGGAYSGMGIVGEQNVQGMGGQSENQHEFQPSIPMPNLSDMSWYEERATAEGTTVSIGGVTQVDGVLGDGGGEKQHLFLVGTQANPIVLDGPVVVRGSVVISGYVTGQGSIYAGGNIYVPSNLNYLNPPATPRPASNDQATVEAWRAASANRDSLGLFAREHVVVGDYTASTWQNNVSGWINHPLNKSSEDAGLDGIQNTSDGPDGVSGTADDDVLEGDGEWTVSQYTQDDSDNGLIPEGFSVGDVIPGSGEDIDGDGVFDGTTQMSEFDIPAALDSSSWAGNLSESFDSFSDVSTLYISHIDAAFYTNHTLAAVMINWGGDIAMNGSIVSRNESIIYGANSIQMNHDERLTGRGSAAAGFDSAVGWDPIEHLQWEFDKALPENIIGAPQEIVDYYTGTGEAS
jgi:hypothetical protein